MTTNAGLAEAVANATHVPKPEVCQRIRALREAGLLPTAASRHQIPRVTTRQAIALLLATLRGGPIKDTVESAVAYSALREEPDSDFSLAAALESEIDEVLAGRGLLAELVLVDDPVVASIRCSDGSCVTFNDAGPVRYATRLVRLNRAGFETFARALDA